MKSPGDGEGSSADALLARLRAGGRAEHDAIVEVQAMLEGAAAKQLGAKAGQVDVQPESVAQEVLALELPRLRGVAQSDDELKRGLFGEVKRKIIDRLRKPARRGGGVAIDAEEGVEPAATGPGPGTQAAAHESVSGSVGASAAARLADLINEVLTKPEDRQICWLYMCEGRRGEQVAASLSMTVGNVRVRAHRFKLTVAQRVLGAMRGSLDEREYAIADQVLVQGLEIGKVARAEGSTEAKLEERIKSAVIPAAKKLFGPHGVRFFSACLARDKSTRSKR